METSETSNFSMESVEQKKRELKNGILAVEMEAGESGRMISVGLI